MNEIPVIGFSRTWRALCGVDWRQKTSVSPEQPAAIYQQEVERVENLNDFLQDTVDRQGSEMDAVK